MTDEIDIETLLDEAFTKKDQPKRKYDEDSYKRIKRSRSRSRSRSPRQIKKSSKRSPEPRERSRRSPYERNTHRRSPDRKASYRKSPSRRSPGPRSPRGREYDIDRRGRRQRTPSPPSNRVPLNEMEPLTIEERDARTVFLRQLARDVRARDIENFFRSVGKIRDVRMITDRNSHRPKGIAYVEFQNIDAVSQAIRMSGEKLQNQSVIIQATMAEKNRAAMEAAALAKQYGPTKLYIGGLHADITEPMLKAIFEPFGPIDYVQLQYDSVSGHSKGFGFVHFKDSDHARHAVEKLNGFELAGKPIKVCHVNEKADFNFVVHDDFTRKSGVKPAGSTAGAVAASSNVTRRSEPATSCVQLSNVFDSFKERDSSWVKEIEKDVKKQVSHYGVVQHLFVDKNSVEGNVYMRFAKPEEALVVVSRLKGRVYAGRVIQAVLFPQFTYQTMFPNA